MSVPETISLSSPICREVDPLESNITLVTSLISHYEDVVPLSSDIAMTVHVTSVVDLEVV